MTLFTYKLNDTVCIVPLETNGRVIALYFCEDGPQYKVRYFYEGQARMEYFYADEIHEHKDRTQNKRNAKEQA